MENSFNQPPVIQNIKQPSKLDKLYQFTRSPLVWLVSGALLVTIIIAVVIVATSPKTPVYKASENGKTSLEDISTLLPNLPEEYLEEIETELYLQTTSDLIGTTLKAPASAAIRKDSLSLIDVNEDFHIGDFIVDLVPIKFSYIISYSYGSIDDFQIEPSNAYKIYCIEDESLIIYPDFDTEACSADTDFQKPDAISYVLPYEADGFRLYSAYSKTTKKYDVTISYDPSDPASLAPSEKENEEAISRAKEYLKSQGLNPENYSYHFESEGEGL